jgi:hypothetical protein
MDICAICLEKLEFNTIKKECNHIFHKICYENVTSNCPCCYAIDEVWQIISKNKENKKIE